MWSLVHWKGIVILSVIASFLFIMIHHSTSWPRCQNSSSPSVDWKTIDVNLMTANEFIEYFYWTNSTSCRLSQDFGGLLKEQPSAYDGQKAICLDEAVAPRAGRCLVYSIGISNEWSFDETMQDYGCRVHAFDPSMNAPDHDHTDAIRFHNLGLDARDHVNERGWKMKTLRSIYQMLGHKRKIIDYFKMDIESKEWEVMPQIVSSGMLGRIRQMGIEFHLPNTQPLEKLRQLAGIIKSIEDAGMVRFDSKANLWAQSRSAALNYTGPMNFELAWYQVLPFD